MIYFNNVTKLFKTDFWTRPVLALNGLTAEIADGKLVGFLGANGAGKTTAIKILMGLTAPTSGEVTFAPHLGRSHKEVMKHIGLLPERPYFYSYLLGQELIEYIAQLHGFKKSEIQKKISFWAERLGIAGALKRKVGTYSKGMLQRLGMVCVLVHDPRILVLDEPLSGLDPIGRQELKDVLKEVHQLGKTIFFSSHILTDIEEICQEIICLHKGLLTYSGSVKQLLAQHHAPYRLMIKKPFSFPLPANIISAKDYPEGVMVLVSSAEKDYLLNYIVEKKGTIDSLEQEKKGLQDFFFKEWSQY